MSLNTIQIKIEKDLKWPKILIAILSTIGIADTGSITLKNWGLFNSLSCPGVNKGCDAVLNSPWGTLIKNEQLNIPLSFAGLLTYSTILFVVLILSLKIISPKQKIYKNFWWFLYLISCGSSVFSILLISIMIIKIKSFCFFCLLSAILSCSIFILTIIGARFDNRETMFYRGLIVAFTVLIGGLIWSNQVDPVRANEINVSNEKVSPVVKTVSSKEKINFAKFLSDNNIVMYSAYWCPHCHDQKELFGKKAVEELIIVECAKDGKNNKYNLCQEKGIEGFPSWEINNEIYSGTMNLDELADMTAYDGDVNFE
tara:strand:- start:492 stop:1430 length:939 start_codon:yes stop_codon:yes gene_type:complete